MSNMPQLWGFSPSPPAGPIQSGTNSMQHGRSHPHPPCLCSWPHGKYVYACKLIGTRQSLAPQQPANEANEAMSAVSVPRITSSAGAPEARQPTVTHTHIYTHTHFRGWANRKQGGYNVASRKMGKSLPILFLSPLVKTAHFRTPILSSFPVISLPAA